MIVSLFAFMIIMIGSSLLTCNYVFKRVIVFYILIGSLHYTRMDAISFASLVFSAMEDGFSHPVDIFFALVLALPQIDA